MDNKMYITIRKVQYNPHRRGLLFCHVRCECIHDNPVISHYIHMFPTGINKVRSLLEVSATAAREPREFAGI